MNQTDMRWSLMDLYPSFEDESFKKDFETLGQKIQQTNQWAEEMLISYDHEAEKIVAYLEKMIAIRQIYIKLSSFSSLTKSVEARNSLATQSLGKVEEQYANLKKAQVLFLKWLKKVEDIDAIIDCSEFLMAHQFHIKELIAQSQYLLSDEEELLISKLTNTGAKAWSNLQQLLTSTLLVEIEVGEEVKSLPLQVVRNMAYDTDPVLRKRAFEAELKSYNKIAESSAAALNGIKGEELIIGNRRGFESPLEETLKNSRMGRKTLDAMLGAMEESLPIFRRYLRQKAQLLGHTNGLPFYDLFAPMGTIEKEYTYQEAMEYVISNFSSFSKNMGNYAEKAYRNRWIDVEPREGKRGGAFCYFIRPIKQSRVLVNFTGSFKNITTLAHELGHGFHGECLKEERLLNCTYPMPLAETASIFAETILVKNVLESGTKQEKFSVLESTISHATQVIVDIYSRFLFESEVFNRRRDHVLSVPELNEIMMDAQKKAYGDGLDSQVLHPFMWVNKVHYYYPERHFYNFPYAFGILFSKGLFAQYLKEGDTFPEKYETLLRATGKMAIEDVAKIVGIDVNDRKFWRSSLKLIEADIESFINLSKENK